MSLSTFVNVNVNVKMSNVKMSKCPIVKMLRCQNVRMSEFRMSECQNVRMLECPNVRM